MRIFAVDDEASSLFFLKEAIEEALPDAEITTFDDPTALLTAFREAPADLVFCDIEMPEIGGLELASLLKEIQPELNIIFVTGYDEYALEAFRLYASAYITKPCKTEDIKRALSNLRYPLQKPKELFIKTFGNFDLFYHGKPIAFRSKKSKELLAYLVDREGALVSRQEVAGYLFEDDYSNSVQVGLSKIAAKLAEDLKSAGIENFFINNNGYYVDMSLAECDLSEFLKGSKKYTYLGEYMEQYSFAEYRKAKLNELG